MTTPTPTISTTDTRSLPQLATEINRVHKLIIEDKKTSFERATEIGQMLSRAKHLNGNHGDWLEWLHRSCPDISDRTAQLYMRLGKPENAKKLEEAAEANTQRVADLSVRVAQQMLAKPKTDGKGGKTPRARKAAVEAASAAVTLSPDLKDLLQSTAPDGLVTALKEANWNVEQVQELIKILTSSLQPSPPPVPGDLSIPPSLQRSPPVAEVKPRRQIAT